MTATLWGLQIYPRSQILETCMLNEQMKVEAVPKIMNRLIKFKNHQRV